MNKEFAERWVADLRDPNNKQCGGVLHDGVGYCCLGRAVVIGGFKLVPMKIEDEDGPEDAIVETTDRFVIDGSQNPDKTNGEEETLDFRAMEALGFSNTDGSPGDECQVLIRGQVFEGLADANDAGITFAEIADWVEKNWERL